MLSPWADSTVVRGDLYALENKKETELCKRVVTELWGEFGNYTMKLLVKMELLVRFCGLLGH